MRYRTPKNRRPNVSKYKMPEVPAEAAEIAKAAVRKWCEQNLSPAAIKENVWHRLDSECNKILLGVLGLRESFGKYEITQNGHSPLQALADDRIAEAASAWLDENFGELPKLGGSVIAELRRQYLRTYQEKLRKILTDVAEEQAEVAAKEIIDNVLSGRLEGHVPAVSTPPSWKIVDDGTKHTIVEEAEVLLIVAVADGMIYNEGIEIPNREVGYLMALINRTFQVRAHIVVSGGQWIPVCTAEAPFTEDGQISCEIGHFSTEKSKIFELMTAADFKVIEQSIAAWTKGLFGAEPNDCESNS